MNSKSSRKSLIPNLSVSGVDCMCAPLGIGFYGVGYVDLLYLKTTKSTLRHRKSGLVGGILRSLPNLAVFARLEHVIRTVAEFCSLSRHIRSIILLEAPNRFCSVDDVIIESGEARKVTIPANWRNNERE